MNHDEHDELWELLGKAKAPKERPFFAAKVLNAIKQDAGMQDAAQEPKGLMAWWMSLRRRWVLSLATCSAVAVATALVLMPHSPKTVVMTPTAAVGVADPLSGLAEAIETSDDLVTSLDNMMAAQDNSIWLQAAPSSLY